MGRYPPITILEDQHGYVVKSMVNWKGTDKDQSVPMVAGAQEKFPELRAASFDRGFLSTRNRAELDELLERDVLPKKGRLNEAERARETAPESRR